MLYTLFSDIRVHDFFNIFQIHINSSLKIEYLNIDKSFYLEISKKMNEMMKR